MKKICWNYRTPGIPDELFVRGNVPMTKEEVRAITLSKLRLREDSIVVDVGAGTGSIAIEAAQLCPKGKVIAIERKEEGVALIRENCTRFQVEVEILHGNAAHKLKAIEVFDRVIIGGSGGELEEIIQLCYDKLTKDGRIVVNSITLETLYTSIQCLEKIGFSYVEAVSVNVARGRKVGRYTLMEAINPIYVISGVKT
ncbi:precorrin-6Y C5,15-methyltransferase (decarboxylating) subunit CbiT [Thermotalea metallivorans]|uniref:Cobalamin biosynthesis bifunctional protein CbiET n=1 Tax=Thermotalea metallivorans TaxID=520762 RepID=A0A140LED6_9FIRM|nr:precorrin-6Y C5,15-methyltransferase (decarboxylating) subunit CbiT [Thermotalea metallivorans]KXG78911.1 Cobalamin biosynthesis bifunctional protein CbiET [Thermotalea metallivorans]